MIKINILISLIEFRSFAANLYKCCHDYKLQVIHVAEDFNSIFLHLNARPEPVLTFASIDIKNVDVDSVVYLMYGIGTVEIDFSVLLLCI